jgi:hypothetical protein
MSFTFTVDFAPGDTVTVVALERPAFVELVRVDDAGRADYFVAWWDEGKRCSAWMPRRELAP